jgi:uncharacterized protein YyaL (SSP411 family)/aryl-alcohol dehydrogenase-like predicted oxidoreductase
MSSERDARRPNRLIHETSPYLLQHAYNPVDWHPWGREALALARERDRPILLSVGYSACHWCHVMERESFEDNAIAALMNEHFVCIKVDREERPDLDEIYMQATLALNHGQGGWPMTVFLTPEQEPIFAGTYFPPTDRWGRPGFASVLRRISDLWRKDPVGLRREAASLTERLKQSIKPAAPLPVGQAELDEAVAQYAEAFDARHGGFGSAPKFPPATGLSFLMQRSARTQDAHALRMVRKTLDAMAAGGLYDQIGGGFARYSTDDTWLVPHFEKMLYDNALLARTYVEAYQLTGTSDYRRIATETLDYILRDMTDPSGGFYSATDADSEGVEGKFFVWTPEQIRAALPSPEDSRLFCAYYDITDEGNWEHVSIPHVPRPSPDAAAALGVTVEELHTTLERTKPLVYETRRKRVPPGLDDKILTAWNGMMLGAMAEGGRAFGETRYVQGAQRAADFLLQTMIRPDGGLYRTCRAGKAHLQACLEDYAYLAEGLIDLYEAGADERYLREAVRLAERIVADFSDRDHGGFFTTAHDHETLIVRSREGPDGATPSGNAAAAAVLARLSFHCDRDDFRQAAVDAIRVYGAQIARYPRAFAKSLMVVDLLLHGPTEAALVGQAGEPVYERLARSLHSRYLPQRIMAHGNPADRSSHPLLQGKTMVEGRPALYLCRHYSCRAPITDPDQVAAALQTHHGAASSSGADVSRGLAGARLKGHATVAGTAAYAVRMVNDPANPHRPLHGYATFGAAGWTVSRLGFGCYRVDAEAPEHRAALEQALRQGCNLIDTSANYGDGDSERLVGSVLADGIRRGTLKREEIVVVSKIGYIQGHNFKRVLAREKADNPYPDLVKYADGLWHCLHPEFLADQLERSLDRLGLDTLDVCLLHNPEYFLMDAAKRNQGTLEERRYQFYGRLRAAFGYLESQVAAGRLACYGVSSNTCTASPDDPEATSLSRILEVAQLAAQAVGRATHHCRVLQCPMNLFESGALLTPNTGERNSRTVLDLAREERLAVLVNRPLNAIPAKGASMVRLADLPLEQTADTFESHLARVAELEDEYRTAIAPHVPHGGQGLAPVEYFTWAKELARVRAQVQGLEHWEQVESTMIAPHVNQVLSALAPLTDGPIGERWQRWRERYLPELVGLLSVLRREATIKSRRRTNQVAQALLPWLPDRLKEETLSRKALWVLVSTPGVTCALNGMRTPAYVEDSLAVLGWEPLPDVRPLYERLTTVTLS